MAVLSDYIAGVRRLLHDPNAQYWSQADLTAYVNEARRRICNDTKCLRQIVTGIALTPGTEAYTIATTVPAVGARVVDVMGINLYFGTLRYALIYQPFVRFNAMVRQWQSYQQRPTMFSRLSQTIVYFGPTPDQAYITDWDVAIEPADLASDGDTDGIPPPYTDPVKYWAAYLAKFQEQAMGEANIFKQEYIQQLRMAARSAMTRVIPDPYAG